MKQLSCCCGVVKQEWNCQGILVYPEVATDKRVKRAAVAGIARTPRYVAETLFYNRNS